MRSWAGPTLGRLASLLVSANLFGSVMVGNACADGVDQKVAQQDIQFLRFGRPLSEQPATVSRSKTLQYERAIRRPDGPTQCANRNATGAIDVSKGMDWTKVSDTFDIEVCIFFAAAELHDIDATSDFLSASGFGSIDRISVEPVVTRFSNIDGYGTILNGGMLIERVPFRIKGIMGSLFAYSLTVSVSLDEAGQPYHSNSGLNIL
jgi:hypothetical protein